MKERAGRDLLLLAPLCLRHFRCPSHLPRALAARSIQRLSTVPFEIPSPDIDSGGSTATRYFASISESMARREPFSAGPANGRAGRGLPCGRLRARNIDASDASKNVFDSADLPNDRIKAVSTSNANGVKARVIVKHPPRQLARLDGIKERIDHFGQWSAGTPV